LATLEFQFLEALEHGKYDISNRERLICANPALFVQAVAQSFRRNDGGTDPNELGIQDAARREEAATAAYRLPDRIKRLPGTDAQSKIDIDKLKAWLNTVRSELKALGREKLAMSELGSSWCVPARTHLDVGPTPRSSRRLNG
jgi:hypothetical protein